MGYRAELFSKQTAQIDCPVMEPDGEVIELKLSQVAGSEVSFLSDNSCPFSIQAPNIEVIEELTLTLAVINNDKLTHYSSAHSYANLRTWQLTKASVGH